MAVTCKHIATFFRRKPFNEAFTVAQAAINFRRRPFTLLTPLRMPSLALHLYRCFRSCLCPHCSKFVNTYSAIYCTRIYCACCAAASLKSSTRSFASFSRYWQENHAKPPSPLLVVSPTGLSFQELYSVIPGISHLS